MYWQCAGHKTQVKVRDDPGGIPKALLKYRDIQACARGMWVMLHN